MLAVGGGSIVNVSSVSPRRLAARAARFRTAVPKPLDNLTLLFWPAPSPLIRVNAVAAQGFITGRWLENGLGDNYERVEASFDNTLPLGRVCEPDDVAAAIFFSLVTGSGLVTGRILAVDSGMLIAGFQDLSRRSASRRPPEPVVYGKRIRSTLLAERRKPPGVSGAA
jgi:NAD(P)-dependent dehydrogenase (short-subunit alcohol dehydrogenase family)